MNTSAIILNNLIKTVNNMQNVMDKLLAVQEFTLGYTSQIRPLDICFGFNTVSPLSTSNQNKDLVIGQGIYSISGATPQSVFPRDTSEDINPYNSYRVYLSNNMFLMPDPYLYSMFPNYYLTEYPIDIQRLIGGTILENVYLFGSVYGIFQEVVSNSSMDAILYTCDNLDGTPLIIVRDIDEDSAIKLLKSGSIGEANIPTESIELYRFIMSIDYFAGNTDSVLNGFTIIPVDMRKPRGWAGFCEENLAINVIPPLISYQECISNLLTGATGLNNAVKNMVSHWVNLSWSGGFVEYWSGAEILPRAIHDYIQANFMGYTDLP